MTPLNSVCPSCGTTISDPNSPYCPKCLIIVNKSSLKNNPSQRDVSNIKNHYGSGVDHGHIDSAKSKIFHSGESLIAALAGSDLNFGILTQYLIVTDIRVIFWKRGIISDINQSFNFEDIGSVEKFGSKLSYGLGGIELNIKGAKEIFSGMYVSDVTLAIAIIRDRIQSNKNRNSQPMILIESIPDQIKKLAGLRDSGILTEQEFSMKKTELLKRM